MIPVLDNSSDILEEPVIEKSVDVFKNRAVMFCFKVMYEVDLFFCVSPA